MDTTKALMIGCMIISFCLVATVGYHLTTHFHPFGLISLILGTGCLIQSYLIWKESE